MLAIPWSHSRRFLCGYKETGSGNENGSQADVGNIQKLQDMVNSPVKQLQTEPFKYSNTSYSQQLSGANEQCVDE